MVIEWIYNFYNEILNWRKKTHGNKLKYNDDSLIIENPIVGYSAEVVVLKLM